MASISSSTSHPNFRYDVLLSFRGEDTRHNFTDHLYHALKRVGLHPFRDNEEIEIGQELKQEIERAIIESRASIVVLSENYAKSRWCLDELCLIMEQRRKCKHFVLPVFCRVDPSDVRNQRGSFAVEGPKQKKQKKRKWFACFGGEAEEEPNCIEVNVRIRWKAALTDVANLSGMPLSGSMSEQNFIAKVAEIVRCKLDMKHEQSYGCFRKWCCCFATGPTC